MAKLSQRTANGIEHIHAGAMIAVKSAQLCAAAMLWNQTAQPQTD
jgi:hypothetical protein